MAANDSTDVLFQQVEDVGGGVKSKVKAINQSSKQDRRLLQLANGHREPVLVFGNVLAHLRIRQQVKGKPVITKCVLIR